MQEKCSSNCRRNGRIIWAAFTLFICVFSCLIGFIDTRPAAFFKDDDGNGGEGGRDANCSGHVFDRAELIVDIYIKEVLSAWRAKARCNVVSAERTQELFHELSFHPSDKQISEMLQTVKMLARKGSRQSNGLTFGEFCVLAADLRRFRSSTFPCLINDKVSLLSSLQNDNRYAANPSETTTNVPVDLNATQCSGSKTIQPNLVDQSTSNDNCTLRSNNSVPSKKTSDASPPLEVFLGGSCNPTTWRADVAIPTLKELGISFYNPQVSDWTPDLIELEHRAKEKARVLFFVIDSETRASAGAIEAAHIAGQNCKQLVLVLHPYKSNQAILNEQISQQEFIDLTRNQLMLYELVTRRGLPVLDNIPSGLQRTKDILAGIRDPPSNIASILVVVRGAFDRVSPSNDLISFKQCRQALSYLGYAQSLLHSDNLNKIITSQRESLQALHRQLQNNSNSSLSGCQRQQSIQNDANSPSGSNTSSSSPFTSTHHSAHYTASAHATNHNIDFDLFCVISAYLSVLQQEIQESGCISPIKGTNVPPPPVYLTNLTGDETFSMSYVSKNISRTSSNASVPNSSSSSGEERQSLYESYDALGRSRDSGTSSPQPSESFRSTLKSASTSSASALGKQNRTMKILVNVESIETTTTTEITTTTTQTTIGNPTGTTTTIQHQQQIEQPTTEEESDSNDSVFSSSSSINSVNYNHSSSGDWLSAGGASGLSGLDLRDVYLGGSCYLRTKWRQKIAMPLLKSNGITFHLPALHESIDTTRFDANNQTNSAEDVACSYATQTATPSGTSMQSQERAFNRTRRKCPSARQLVVQQSQSQQQQQLEEVEETYTVSEESSFSWATPPPMRTNLYNPALLDASRVLLFVITNETRSLAPMTLAAHCIGLMYNVVLAVQMLPDDCVISNEKLTPVAIKDYNRGRAYLIDLAKRQGVPVYDNVTAALECTVEKVKAFNSRNRNKYD